MGDQDDAKGGADSVKGVRQCSGKQATAGMAVRNAPESLLAAWLGRCDVWILIAACGQDMCAGLLITRDLAANKGKCRNS